MLLASHSMKDIDGSNRKDLYNEADGTVAAALLIQALHLSHIHMLCLIVCISRCHIVNADPRRRSSG